MKPQTERFRNCNVMSSAGTSLRNLHISFA